jgi:hypothetical protein
MHVPIVRAPGSEITRKPHVIWRDNRDIRRDVSDRLLRLLKKGMHPSSVQPRKNLREFILERNPVNA